MSELTGTVVPTAESAIDFTSHAARTAARDMWLRSLDKRSRNTQDAYRRDVERWFRWCDQEKVDVGRPTRADGDAYRDWLTDTLDPLPASLARYLSVVSSFYAYWVVEGAIDRNPMGNVRRPRVANEPGSVALTRDQLRVFLSYVNRLAERGDLRPAVIVYVLAVNGIRVSELCSATVADLGMSGGHRILTVTRKGNIRATVAVSAPVSTVIDAYLAGRTEGWLVQTSKGTPLHRGYIRLLLRRLAREAGLPREVVERMHPHVLRHTSATLLDEAGVAIQEIQRHLGHAHASTTQRYMQYKADLDASPVYALTRLLSE